MQTVQAHHPDESRLRFIFYDTVVSLSLATEVKLAEIAEKRGTLSTRGYGRPIAIDITLGSREGEILRRALGWPDVDLHVIAPLPGQSA